MLFCVFLAINAYSLDQNSQGVGQDTFVFSHQGQLKLHAQVQLLDLLSRVNTKLLDLPVFILWFYKIEMNLTYQQ